MALMLPLSACGGSTAAPKGSTPTPSYKTPADNGYKQWRRLASSNATGKVLPTSSQGFELYATDQPSGVLRHYSNDTPEGQPITDLSDFQFNRPTNQYALTADGAIYGLIYNEQSQNAVVVYTGTLGNWKQLGNPDNARVAQLIRGKSKLYAIVAGGNIYEYAGTPAHWTRIGWSTAGDFSKTSLVVSGSTLYGISLDGHSVYQYQGTPGKWTSILTLPTGSNAGLMGDWASNELYLSRSGPGQSSNRYVDKYSGTPNNWSTLGSIDIQTYAVCPGFLATLSTSRESIWAFKGKSVKQIGSAAASLAASPSALYAVDRADGSIWQYPLGAD